MIKRIRENAVAWIVFLFAFLYSFFRFKYVVISPFYSNLVWFVNVFLAIFSLRYCVFNRRSGIIPFYISWLGVLIIFTIFTAKIFWGQSLYGGIKMLPTVTHVLLLLLLVKCNIGLDKIARAMIILAVAHSMLTIISIATFPNNIFGFLSKEGAEFAESFLESRGVIRLNLPGADFIVVTIFIVITHYKDNKIKYLWLVPLFVILFLRGTRTPFFIATAIVFLYSLYQYGHRIISTIVVVSVTFLIYINFSKIVVYSGGTILGNYLEITTAQLEADLEEDDIRIRCSQYYFKDFNKTNLQVIFGNGIPFGKGKYGEQMFNDVLFNHYYLSDVGFVEIFIYYGILGLIIYLLIFIAILRSTVPPKYYYAKLYIIYGYMLLPTNVMIITGCPIIFAMTLYIIHKSSSEHSLLGGNV